MFWKRLTQPTGKPLGPFEHSSLGPIEFDEEEEAWVAHPTIAGRTIRFVFGGEQEPGRMLIPEAESIVKQFDEFHASIRGFLEREATSKPGLAQEIEQLEISHVCLFWPERPNAGMIFFSSSNGSRVWHCDYINRAPKSLGFDS